MNCYILNWQRKVKRTFSLIWFPMSLRKDLCLIKFGGLQNGNMLNYITTSEYSTWPMNAKLEMFSLRQTLSKEYTFLNIWKRRFICHQCDTFRREVKTKTGKPEALEICPFIITSSPRRVIFCDGTEPALLPNHSNKCFSITAVSP